MIGERGRAKKTGPVKKEWQVGRDNDHGGRGRRRPGSHGGGWCRRAEPARPGAYALLSRADGQLTRAGQRYCSHLACGRPARTRLQPAPHPRGAQRLHPAAQRAEEARALPARRAPADQAGQGLERRDWLPVNKLGGAMTRHPAHLTEEQVAQRVRQQEASLAGGPILQLLDKILLTLSTGWSAPRARTTGTLGPRWRRSCASA